MQFHLLCVSRKDSPQSFVHDLSFPESKSVNDAILNDSYLSVDHKLRLTGIDRLVSFILKKGRGCELFKRDLRRRYRQIPADPKNIPLLGFQVDGHMFFHRVFPFGERSCVLCCQRTTKSVVFILESEDIC